MVASMRWIVGDIHGMLAPLNAVLNEVWRRDPQGVIYFAGDYVNRGPASRGVIDLLLSLDRTRVRFIRGNHDDVFDLILHGQAYADSIVRSDRFMAIQWFSEHGLIETLNSYGATYEQILTVLNKRTRDSLDAIIDRVPPAHRQFIRSLPACIDDPDLFVIHGKWPLKESQTPQQLLGSEVPIAGLRHEVLWGRFTDAELDRPRAWPKKGFFGHTPVPTYDGHDMDFEPIIRDKLILLDTAAALTPLGRLTAVAAETMDIVQATPAGKLVG